MRNIVILGDSHTGIYLLSKQVNVLFNVLKIIHTDALDVSRNGKFKPYLMNTIGNNGQLYLSHHIDKYKDTAEYMMFIFGEPDVRIHFDKQINLLKRDEDEVIETLCKNYINKLIEITPKNIKIIVRYLLPQREYSMYNTIYTPNGSIDDRVRYTNKMNSKLKEICQEKRILFFDNYEKNKLVNSNGSLQDVFCDGTTHYNSSSIFHINKEVEIFFETFIKSN